MTRTNIKTTNGKVVYLKVISLKNVILTTLNFIHSTVKRFVANLFVRILTTSDLLLLSMI